MSRQCEQNLEGPEESLGRNRGRHPISNEITIPPRQKPPPTTSRKENARATALAKEGHCPFHAPPCSTTPADCSTSGPGNAPPPFGPTQGRRGQDEAPPGGSGLPCYASHLSLWFRKPCFLSCQTGQVDTSGVAPHQRNAHPRYREELVRAFQCVASTLSKDQIPGPIVSWVTSRQTPACVAVGRTLGAPHSQSHVGHSDQELPLDED